MTESSVQPERSSIGTKRNPDWTRQRGGMLIGWLLPIVVGMAGSQLPAAIQAAGVAAFVWAACLAWMGTACLLNARRCHRLHCYLASSILLVGAMLAGLLVLGIVSFGPHGLNNLVSVILVLVLLTYVPEWVWGRYTRR